MSEYPEDISRAAVKAVLEAPIEVPRTTEVINAVCKAILADRQRDQWQDISTAPRDWTDIILYLPDEDDGSGSCGVVKGWFSMKDGGFDCWMSYESNSGQCYPTHWQPLPSVPKGNLT